MTEQREQKVNHVLRYRQNDLTVVLENVFDPHNISAVMRSCDAVGIMEIFVVNTLFPHKKYGPRSSSSADKWMMVHQFTDIETCMKAVRAKYQKVYSTHLSTDSKSIYDLNLTESVALVFGNERKGLSQAMLDLCDGNFLIPQVGMITSLNISVACAVSIYEAFRQKQVAGHYQQKKVNAAEQQALMHFWPINIL
jgi:tRNA (guanosine-2'-O-)-methyltransferase